jgi:hypothetical protein
MQHENVLKKILFLVEWKPIFPFNFRMKYMFLFWNKILIM